MLKYLECQQDIRFYNLLLSNVQLTESFEKEFLSYYNKRILKYPFEKMYELIENNKLIYSTKKICEINAKLFEQSKYIGKLLATKPYLFLNIIYFNMLKSKLPKSYEYAIDFKGLYSKEILKRIQIHNLSTKTDNQLVMLEGIVRNATAIYPTLKYGFYICKSCELVFQTYHEYNYYVTPECNGRHCKKSQMFLDETQSTYVDILKVDIQETQKDLTQGEQPKTINAFCELRQQINLIPGTELTLAVIVKRHDKDTKGTPFYQRYLEIIGAERTKVLQKEDTAIIDNIKNEVNKNPEAFLNKCIEYISPVSLPIEIKKAIFLQMIGGVRKPLNNSAYLRGDIHILVIGSPGIGKSQLLKNCAKLTKGVYVSGVSASSVGLTAAVVKDSMLANKWAVEAGAFVYADNRYLCLDELDKIPISSVTSIHEAMEQQSVSIAKAGLVMTLNTRCPVLAAANPINGQFLEDIPVYKQINITPTILNRFDLVFVLNSEEENTFDLSQSIFKLHQQKKINKQMDDNTFTSYINLCKFYKPVLTKTVIRLISSLYTKIKKQSTILVTARQLECLIRLVEANARSRFSQVIEEIDYNVVEPIILYTLTKQNGSIDSNYIETGISKKEFTYRGKLLKLVKQNEKITHQDLLKHFNTEEKELITLVLDKLVKVQAIYKPTYNTYALI
jgi:replicative DNA helicase Mcm